MDIHAYLEGQMPRLKELALQTLSWLTPREDAHAAK